MIYKIATTLFLTCALTAQPPTLFLQDCYFLQFPAEIEEIQLLENPAKIAPQEEVVHIRKIDPAEIVRCEMIAHVPLLAHENPRSVLIFGDEDGGITKQVLKHPTVERIFIVSATDQKNPIADERISRITEDPARFVKKSDETFDVILCDIIYQAPPAEFYAHCKDLLNKRGIFVNNSGTPLIELDSLGPVTANRAPHFKHTTYYLASTPQGQVAYGWASDKKYRVSESILEMRLTKIKEPMLYYTPEVHRAAFALPNFILSCTSSN